MTGHAFSQYNNSALEPDQSPGSHSALVEFASSGVVSLRIRCHETRGGSAGLRFETASHPARCYLLLLIHLHLHTLTLPI